MPSVRRIEDLLNNLPAGVVVHDASGQIQSANRLACDLLGHDAGHLLGMGASSSEWKFVGPDSRQIPAQQFPVNRVLETRCKVENILVGIPESDAVRWLICNAYPEFDAAGKLAQVVVCFTDCTSLKEVQQRLQKSEERLSLILRASSDAPWDWDLVVQEIYYSDSWWTMLGYLPGSLPVTPQLWRDLLHPDDRPAVEAFVAELMMGPLESYSIEIRLRHKDGHDVPILSRGFVLRDEYGRAVRISGTNEDLTLRKISDQRIHHLAFYDSLTDLPNRSFLSSGLITAFARSKRSGQIGAVVFMDLDNFKVINDSKGHQVGDLLLCQVASRLRATVRHSDQLARLGGDEFVIVLEDLGSSFKHAEVEAGHVVEKLRHTLAQPYNLVGCRVTSTPSMGVVLFDGYGGDVATLLKHADLAMYQAKREGRNRTCFFSPSMEVTANYNAKLEQAMHEGLSHRQFVLFCQPQFSREGELTGAEVLLRWRGTTGQITGPGDFIGLAESSGFILTLGQYVLEESCRALARWQSDKILSSLKMAVNVSVQQMRSPNFADQVIRTLTATGAPPGRLCIEITESVFATDADAIIDCMNLLRQSGIHFSLDDFGTGYSSLAYLRLFPISTLKIDRAFVRDIDSDPDAVPIVEAIIALAQKLKLDAIAEGVETKDQHRILIASGCMGYQGYLLGRPIPIEEFERRYGSTEVVF